MFGDVREEVLTAFVEAGRRRGPDLEDGLSVMAWPARDPDVSTADIPALEREARLALPLRGLLDASERRGARHARLVEQRLARGPQRVGNVSRGVARRADPAYRERERVRQARAARERRRRAREAASSGA